MYIKTVILSTHGFLIYKLYKHVLRDLEEGDDVYFECHIKAHPPVHRVLWRHNVGHIKPLLYHIN